MNRLLEGAATAPAAWSPAADMRETDDAYLIEAEPPGIKRDDIDIEMSEREVHITGDCKEREREGVLRRSTRRTGHRAASSTRPFCPQMSGRTRPARPSTTAC